MHSYLNALDKYHFSEDDHCDYIFLKFVQNSMSLIVRGTDGNRLDNEVIASIQQFQEKERHGFIDVW